MTLFKERYRIESPRLSGKDYTDNGTYFVTICTRGGAHVFGEIQNGMMCLSELGTTIAKEWQHTEQLRYYVTLDRWVIMPNHMHAIMVIQRNPTIDSIQSAKRRTFMRILTNRPASVETRRRPDNHTVLVETRRRPDNHTVLVETRRRRVSTAPMHMHWKAHSLGSIINQFKTACTKRIRAMGYDDFAWQRQFYDHIVRNDESLFRIRYYIRNNPQRWKCEEMDKNPVKIPRRGIST